jgi:hypothetical protein
VAWADRCRTRTAVRRFLTTYAASVSDRTLERELRGLARALAGPESSRLERAAALLRIAQVADRLARAEVAAARELDAASWTDVGDALGVSRQTAHERYRSGPDGGASRLTYPARS